MGGGRPAQLRTRAPDGLSYPHVIGNTTHDLGYLPQRPVSFSGDIASLFLRLSALQWVNQGIYERYGYGSPEDLADPVLLASLADPTPAAEPLRRQWLARFRDPGLTTTLQPDALPPIYGDAVAVPANSPRNWIAVTPLQYRALITCSPRREVVIADVLVLGLGPAGYAAAIRAARLGERGIAAGVRRARHCFVEHLPPQALPLLPDLGLWPLPAARECPGVLMHWGSGGPRSRHDLFHPHGSGYLIDREAFELQLRQRAESEGGSIVDEFRRKRRRRIRWQG